MIIFKWYTLTRKKVVHFNLQNDIAQRDPTVAGQVGAQRSEQYLYRRR